MTKEEFKFILDRQQSSGLSVRDFCENEALASYVLGQIQLLYKIERSADQDNCNKQISVRRFSEKLFLHFIADINKTTGLITQ
ncbi:MAG: hypothetical protein ACRDD6_13570 [Tannerellaceae bacterium]